MSEQLFQTSLIDCVSDVIEAPEILPRALSEWQKWKVWAQRLLANIDRAQAAKTAKYFLFPWDHQDIPMYAEVKVGDDSIDQLTLNILQVAQGLDYPGFKSVGIEFLLDRIVGLSFIQSPSSANPARETRIRVSDKAKQIRLTQKLPYGMLTQYSHPLKHSLSDEINFVVDPLGIQSACRGYVYPYGRLRYDRDLKVTNRGIINKENTSPIGLTREEILGAIPRILRLESGVLVE